MDEYERWLAQELDDADLRPELLSIQGLEEEIKDRFAVAYRDVRPKAERLHAAFPGAHDSQALKPQKPAAVKRQHALGIGPAGVGAGQAALECFARHGGQCSHNSAHTKTPL